MVHTHYIGFCHRKGWRSNWLERRWRWNSESSKKRNWSTFMRKKLPKWFTSSLEKNGCKKRNHWNHQFVWQGSWSTMTSHPLAPLKLIGHGHCPPWPEWPPWFRCHAGDFRLSRMVLKSEIIEIWVVTWRKMHLSHVAFKVEFLISHRFSLLLLLLGWYPSSLFVGTKRKESSSSKTRNSFTKNWVYFCYNPSSPVSFSMTSFGFWMLYLSDSFSKGEAPHFIFMLAWT